MAKMNQAMSDLFRYNSAILARKRSSFDKSHSHTTTFDSGYLIPLMWDRVIPGDEKKIKYSGLARMATPIHPIMDEANLDVWCFYIPDRLWWTHAREFYGENKDASFNPDGEYVMPYLKPSQYCLSNTVEEDFEPVHRVGSLNDYFGFPVMDGFDFENGNDDSFFYASAGLHRCYQLIWNEWYRNSSIQPALQLNDGDTVSDEEWSVISKIRKVNKYPDLFTTLLREPQAGDDVYLPLGEYAPVVASADRVPYSIQKSNYMTFDDASGRTIGTNEAGFGFLGIGDPDDNGADVHHETRYVTLNNSNTLISAVGTSVVPSNLWTDLTNATSATINNLRAAITVQHLLELDALAGKRYQTILRCHFSVLTPDSTLQRPELLGATRTPVGMRQVIQTSETSGDSPLGNVAAFSLTNIANEWICNKSFTEPGFIMVLGAVRPVQSYSQGLDPLLQRLSRFEHFWPVFDNIGNQPVYTSSIYMASHEFGDGEEETTLENLKSVLGYSEAWIFDRTKQNRVSGLMRPDVRGTLSSWNYSMNFTSAPLLDSSFIEVDPSFIDRTIAVPSEPQFICDSYFEYIDIKNMSVHSVPGLNRL